MSRLIIMSLLYAAFCTAGLCASAAQDVSVSLVGPEADVSQLPKSAACVRIVNGSGPLLAAATSRCATDRIELIGGNYSEDGLESLNSEYGLKELDIVAATMSADALSVVRVQTLGLNAVPVSPDLPKTLVEQGVMAQLKLCRIEPLPSAIVSVFIAGHVTSLEISECNVGDLFAHLEELADGSATFVLGSLSIDSCETGENASLTWISRIQNLRKLSLFHNRWLTDSHIVQLGEVPELRSLSLGSTTVTDASLNTIARMTKLEDLDVSGCHSLTAVGFRSLSELALRKLDISFHESIGEYPLRSFAHLEVLNCANVALDDGGIDAISEATSLRQLILANTMLKDRDSFVLITKLSDSLDTLDLSRCEWVDDRVLEHVSKLTNLTLLILWGDVQITNTGVNKLSSLIRLTALELSGCEKITDAAIVGLVALERLEDIRVSGCPLLTSKALATLMGAHALRTLSIVKCVGISQEAVDVFIGKRPNVRVVR